MKFRSPETRKESYQNEQSVRTGRIICYDEIYIKYIYMVGFLWGEKIRKDLLDRKFPFIAFPPIKTRFTSRH